MHALMSAFTPLSRADWHSFINQLLAFDPPITSRRQLGPRDVRRIVDAIEGYLLLAHLMREARRDLLGPEIEQTLAADRYRVAQGDYEGIDNPQTRQLVAQILDLITSFRVTDLTITSGRNINV